MKKRYLIALMLMLFLNIGNVYAEGKINFLVQNNDNTNKIIKISCLPGDAGYPNCTQSTQKKSNSNTTNTDPTDPSKHNNQSGSKSESKTNNTDPTDPNRHNKPGEKVPDSPKVKIPGASGDVDKQYETIKENEKKEKEAQKNKESSNKGSVDSETILKERTDIADCESLFSGEGGEDLLGLLKTAVLIVRISIPILLVSLGTYDFAKAVFSNSEEDMKKAQNKFIKRIIIALGIFLVVPILKVLLGISNQIWGDIISSDFCGIL